MEWVTIILSSLLTLISPVGLVADQVAEGLIRERIHQADLIDVRIDNTPSFRLTGGRVERVRIAGRGVYPIPELRIDVFDVETDPIDIDLPALQSGELALDEPIQAASHFIFRADDLNVLLRSQRIQTLLDTLEFDLPGVSDRQRDRYGFANPQIQFLSGNRVQVTVDIEDRVQQEQVQALVETGLEVIDGHQLVLVEPTVTVDEQPVPRQLIDAFTAGINSELTLKQFEEIDIVARVLRLDLQPETLDIVVFLRIDPASALLNFED
ncbi:DUF2993 domain-containing protein [Oscillatoria sp. CS-180]|uniref:LmeA family phospholipid-binding protein n=1 Tax=Oscillatoria sp. CS-180 TaxID=3021720 RepID=UPI002330C893|nr:DUF2993 domain-containing protein [Oscillatoria sp. CS-180]MDB9526837.1 DUF2993 domain-containing protein [Oscillatoria sp. CS-180]